MAAGDALMTLDDIELREVTNCFAGKRLLALDASFTGGLQTITS